MSRGTAKSTIGRLGTPNLIRQNGEIVPVKFGHKSFELVYKNKKWSATSIPWGDIFTAFHTTGIPNTEVFYVLPKSLKYYPFIQNNLGWLVGQSWFKKLLIKRIDNGPSGPTTSQRVIASSIVQGRVTNGAKESMTATLTGPDGYNITADASLLIVNKIFNQQFKPGFRTPASVYGWELVQEIPGVKMEEG